MPASQAVAERVLVVALRPWTRRLALESVLRWLVRGAIVALVAACLVLAVGWLLPLHGSDVQPVAFQFAAPFLVLGLLIGAWPASRLRRAVQLDTRLNFADRLATAWLDRKTATPMSDLQRSDALRTLQSLMPEKALRYRVPRFELAALAAIAILTLALLVTPSPQEAILRQIQADQQATQQAVDRLDALSQDPSLASTLTPEQARRLNELLDRTKQELSQAKSQKDAVAALTRAEQQLMQLGDTGADAREQALGAMSETLAQEPLTRQLSDALQRSDARDASEALEALREQSNQLSDTQRQALARALQRAANVGRADSRSSNALRDAARAVSAGENPSDQLNSAAQSIEEAMQASAAESAIRQATQRMQDVRTELTTGTPPAGDSSQDQSYEGQMGQAGLMPGPGTGTAVPIDVAMARARAAAMGMGRSEPVPGGDRGTTGGVSGADLTNGQAPASAEPSESIFIPGRAGDGPSDNQDNVQQPFTIRGAPRPFREVIGQYAQQGRDYVDHASVPPNVRELVREYFADLEGQ